MEAFFANIYFQTASCIILATVMIGYFSSKRIAILSTRCFSLMLVFACINLVCDIATVYTITHLDVVPAWFNRLCHQLFIGSLDTMVVLLYLYVAFLGREQRRICKSQVALLLIPYVAAIGFAVFGELNYVVDGNSIYSYGSMVTALYSVVAFYIILANLRIIKYSSSYTKKMRRAIHIGTAFWTVVAVLQFSFKDYLVSSLGVAIMILYLFLSFENPSENFDSAAASFNRRAFQIILAETIERGKPFYVMNMVVDGMTTINTKFGFAAANKLLCAIADEISSHTDAYVCHYRGNSLAVILSTKDEVEKLGEKMIARMGETWTERGIFLSGKYHIDALECPRFANSVDKICETLDYMFDAPHTSGGICFIDESDIRLKERRNAIDELLETALNEDGFNVVYQPIYSPKDKCFSSAEALVRLKNTDLIGYISPEEFIPIAERRGCIGILGEIVFGKVCAFASREKLWEKGVKYIEINLSGLQAADNTVASSYEAIMNQYGVPASFLNFEITETAAVEAGDAMHANMERFLSLGCGFSIDDFGTGYSNLAQLYKMTYDLVKLDKSLIWPCFEEDGARARVILQGIILMAQKLGKEIVAEGVETEEQANWLAKMGIAHLQGYFYSRPIPENEYVILIDKSN